MVLSRVASAHGVALTVWQVNANDRLVLMDVMRANATVQIDIRLGARLPILAGAIGRSVAAVMQLSDEDLRRHFAEVRWRAPPAFKDFKSDVEQARRDGYALDLGNWYPAVHAAASAVVDSSGRPTLCIGGLALAGQRSLDEMRELGVSLREAARVIGRSLRASLQDDVPA
jgi:DNA-binding IclR family transcriptional regulator